MPINRKYVGIDLIALDVLTVALLIIVFAGNESWIRAILGIPFVMLFLGYVVVGALFPRKDSLSYVNRLSLSLGLSITIVVLTGLMLNYFPWGIGLYSITVSISILILFLSVITWYIRGRYRPNERYSISFKIPRWHLMDGLRTSNRVYLSLIAAIILAFVTGIGGFGYMLTKPVEKLPFTEFYILGIDNRADNYPLEVKLGEEGSVIVGIVNHEHEETDYRLEVSLGTNKLYEVFLIILEPEEAWHREIRFAPEQAIERQKVEFRLIKGNDKSSETRYLWLDVKA